MDKQIKGWDISQPHLSWKVPLGWVRHLERSCNSLAHGPSPVGDLLRGHFRTDGPGKTNGPLILINDYVFAFKGGFERVPQVLLVGRDP